MPRRVQNYSNKWFKNTCQACCFAPGACCCSCFCAPCQLYIHRGRILDHNWDHYRCCQGLLPCAEWCKSCTKPCPKCCMVCEAVFCSGWSMFGNRYAIQNKWQIENDCCDNTIMAIMCIVAVLRCICSASGEMDTTDDAVCDLIWCAFTGMIQSQHAVELDHQDDLRKQERQFDEQKHHHKHKHDREDVGPYGGQVAMVIMPGTQPPPVAVMQPVVQPGYAIPAQQPGLAGYPQQPQAAQPYYPQPGQPMVAQPAYPQPGIAGQPGPQPYPVAQPAYPQPGIAGQPGPQPYPGQQQGTY